MSIRRVRTAVLVLALLATTAACGARLDDQERAAGVEALNGGGGDGGGGSEVVGDGSEALATTTTQAQQAQVSGQGGGTTGGTTGGSTGGTAGGAGVAACTPGSGTSKGVTPTEIRVGNVSQLSGLVPGFAQTAVNGIRAYFNYINNQGGVCGRKLVLLVADDRFQAANNRSETEKLAPQVIAFAGSTSVVDDGGAPIIEEYGVADVSLATTPPRVAAKNNFSPNPIDPTPGAGNGTAKVLKYFKAKYGVTRGAIFYQDVATGVRQSNNYKIDFGKAGIEVTAVYPVAPTATDFRSQAQDMKEKKIELVITIAEIGAISNLARAFEAVQYQPKVPFYGAQTYSQKFLENAGDAANGTKIGLIFDIPETGGAAISTFKTWYQRTAPGADMDFFAIFSWTAADLFVQALRAAGPDPTQAKIIAELGKITNYTGGGLVSGVNPAGKKQPPCYHIIEVQGGRWIKTYPTTGYACE